MYSCTQEYISTFYFNTQKNRAMSQNNVFDNSIIIQNNIDNDYSTKLKIRI